MLRRWGSETRKFGQFTLSTPLINQIFVLQIIVFSLQITCGFHIIGLSFLLFHRAVKELTSKQIYNITSPSLSHYLFTHSDMSFSFQNLVHAAEPESLLEGYTFKKHLSCFSFYLSLGKSIQSPQIALNFQVRQRIEEQADFKQ